MGLRLSSFFGGKTLGIDIWDSLTHCLRYSKDEEILLKMVAIGEASSGEKNCMILFSTSPFMTEFGFFAFEILW